MLISIVIIHSPPTQYRRKTVCNYNVRTMFINASNFVCFSFDIISNFVIFNSTLYRTSVVIFINSILFCSAIDIYLHDLLDISLQLKRTQFTN